MKFWDMNPYSYNFVYDTLQKLLNVKNQKHANSKGIQLGHANSFNNALLQK